MGTSVLERTINVFDEAAILYKRNWKLIISAYLGIFILLLAAGVINFILSLDQLKAFTCSSPHESIVLLTCRAPFISQTIITYLLGLLGTFFIIAMYRPFDQISDRKPPSHWASWLVPTWQLSVQSLLVRLGLTVVLWLPLLTYSLLTMDFLQDRLIIKAMPLFTALMTMPFLPYLALAALAFGLSALANVFLIFFEAELVISRKKLPLAIRDSARLARARFADVLVFSLFWFAIGSIVYVADNTLSCVLIICKIMPVFMMAWAFLLLPIQNLSLIILWKRLSRSSVEKPHVEMTETPEEYIKKAKSKMILSWE